MIKKFLVGFIIVGLVLSVIGGGCSDLNYKLKAKCLGGPAGASDVCD